MYFFNTKAFLILAIITAKIIYSGFLVSYISKIALIIWIFRVLSSLKLFIVFYLILDLVLGINLVLNLDLSSLSIFFIVRY